MVVVIIEAPFIIQRRHALQRFFVTDAAQTVLSSDEQSELDQPRHLTPSSLCAVIDDHVFKPTIQLGDGPNEEQRIRLQTLLDEYEDVWLNPQLGKCEVMQYAIETGDHKPIQHRSRRLSSKKKALVQKMVGDLLKAGVILRSNSPWAFLIVLVSKKAGQTRMCIDYRSLITVTKPDVYYLPRISDLIDQLGETTIFTMIDLASGYHQIVLAKDAREKTAFITSEGLYEFKVMLFGLVNAPSTFQRTMNIAFENIDNRDKVAFIWTISLSSV